MSLYTFFSNVATDINRNYEQMLQHRVIEQTTGHFNPLRKYYQPEIATPFKPYQSLQAFGDHCKNLGASILMAIPNLLLGLLSVAYYALMGSVILAAKLLSLPLTTLYHGLFPGEEDSSLSAMGDHLEKSSVGIIGSFSKWTFGVVNAILETLHDVVLLPILFTMTLGTKTTTTGLTVVANGIEYLKDNCFPTDVDAMFNSNP